MTGKNGLALNIHPSSILHLYFLLNLSWYKEVIAKLERSLVNTSFSKSEAKNKPQKKYLTLPAITREDPSYLICLNIKYNWSSATYLLGP